jgi:hypothetical protein
MNRHSYAAELSGSAASCLKREITILEIFGTFLHLTLLPITPYELSARTYRVLI